MIRASTISALVFLLFVILSIATYFQFQDNRLNSSNEEKAFCGTVGRSRSVWSAKDSVSLNVNAQIGKQLFKSNCASCHAKDMKSKLTGPPLGETTKRWAKYPKEDLYNFIRNSQKMIEEEHPMAIAIWEEYQPTIMNNYPNLTDDDIASLFLYVNMDYY